MLNTHNHRQFSAVSGYFIATLKKPKKLWQKKNKIEEKLTGGIGFSEEGLTDEEVREKLLEYSEELRRRDNIMLQTEISNVRGALRLIDAWHFNRLTRGFISMVKLHDDCEESAHAVLVYAKRDNPERNAGVTFQIVDPFDQWTAKDHFNAERKQLFESLKDGAKLFGDLVGEIKTEVSIK